MNIIIFIRGFAIHELIEFEFFIGFKVNYKTLLVMSSSL